MSIISLNTSIDLQKLYIKEIFSIDDNYGDDDNDISDFYSIKLYNKSVLMELCTCIHNIGLNYKIEYLGKRYIRKNNICDIWQLTLTKEEQTSEIINIEEIENSSEFYVYDLETENHHFHAGPGSLIVHNTDSIYVKFNTPENDMENISQKDMIKASLEVAYKCATMLSKTFPHPMELELEKAYHPFFISAKKRYIGDAWEPKNPADPNSIPDKPDRDAKGIVLKRRDNCPLVKKVYGGMIEILMKDHDREKAVKFIENYLMNLVNGQVPIDDLVISKRLKNENDYAKPESIAHCALAKRIKKRAPGSEPKANDRVPYVFVHLPVEIGIRGKQKKILQADKVEDPDYVQKHPNIKIDYGYYILSQLKEPCIDVLKFVIDEKQAKRIFDRYIEKDKKRNLATGKLAGGQRRISDMWRKKS